MGIGPQGIVSFPRPALFAVCSPPVPHCSIVFEKSPVVDTFAIRHRHCPRRKAAAARHGWKSPEGILVRVDGTFRQWQVHFKNFSTKHYVTVENSTPQMIRITTIHHGVPCSPLASFLFPLNFFVARATSSQDLLDLMFFGAPVVVTQARALCSICSPEGRRSAGAPGS